MNLNTHWKQFKLIAKTIVPYNMTNNIPLSCSVSPLLHENCLFHKTSLWIHWVAQFLVHLNFPTLLFGIKFPIHYNVLDIIKKDGS